MDNFAAIDTSAVVWDMDNFNDNRHNYYQLVRGVNNLFNALQNVQINILLRTELQQEMINVFPFSKLPNDYYYAGETFYSFFSKMGERLLGYENNNIQNLTSEPNQIKGHFNQKIREEVSYLLSEMHRSNKTIDYFSFKYLWGNGNLRTKENDNEKGYKTIICDRNNNLQKYFNSITPTFEHNSKHNTSQYHSKKYWIDHPDQRNGFVSQLSCYNGTDNIIPQKLLDERYPELINDCCYSYDNINEVYVVFRITRKNIFHAYDEYDINKIPNEVKNHFNIWKYQWHR